ncbi:MAG: hypothetical protein JJT75_02640 [Opitutales bacterium]|nr:hypothetical protein [Opitutales bacterium]MCH8539839.1 hypothetical protein [Opitutales bacterium]
MKTSSPLLFDPAVHTFPEFDLQRLLKTVFAPEPGQRFAVFIDLENPPESKDAAFLKDPQNSIQKYAYDLFYQPLRGKVGEALGAKGCDLYAYKITGGSNLDLPDEAYTLEGQQVSLEKEVYPRYDIILCISTESATAPLTAFAKKYGFRGATLHGLNQTIVDSGLCVDYEEVSRQTEKLRLGFTKADKVEIDFETNGHKQTLTLILNKQEAQKSHGLCRGGPDVANLPAGEIYFVPEGAEGEFPMQYADGTIGLQKVSGGRITHAVLMDGSEATIAAHNEKLKSDPVTGELGELGFGTQILPVSGKDIQDEKVLGTLHVATGRSDHLGGHLTPELFSESQNATHDDILYSPTKTPGIKVTQARLYRDGQTHVVIENYVPSSYIEELLNG